MAESVEVAHAELVPKLTSPPSVGVVFANSGLAQCKGGITKLLRSLPPAMHAIGGEVDTLVGTRAVGEDSAAPEAAANAPSAEAAEPAGAQEESDMPHFGTPADLIPALALDRTSTLTLALALALALARPSPYPNSNPNPKQPATRRQSSACTRKRRPLTTPATCPATRASPTSHSSSTW